MIVGSAIAVASNAFAQGPQVLATRLERPPKMSADPSDPSWAKCPVVTGFKDSFTNKAAEDQTESRVGYDEEALYVLFVCHDSKPDKIVGREITPEASFNGEDTVTFSIDTYNTHSGASISKFTVNAINTRSETIAGGHSSKAEWRGIWQSTTKRFAGGYIVEMRIPWKILSYPSAGKAVDMDLNFERYQARTKTTTQWAYTTPSFKPELLGRLLGVNPPKKDARSKLDFLAYDAPQIQDGVFTNRVGIDARYAVSSQQTALLSVSPDFLNIEQQIAGISFVHTERFLSDARPFFTEGGDYFSPVGEFEYGIPFYSKRIGMVNIGSKFYGQVSPTAKIGTLGVEQSDGSTATFTNYQVNQGANYSQALYASTYELADHRDALVGTSVTRKFGDWVLHSSDAIDGKDGRTQTAGNASVAYSGAKLYSVVQGQWVDSSFDPVLAYVPWQDRHGYYTYTNYNDTLAKGPIHDWNFFLFTPNFHQADGTIQERGIQTGVSFTTREDQNFSINHTYTEYLSGTDSYWDLSYGINASNRFKQVSVQYQFGEQNSTASRFIDVKGKLRVFRSMDLGLEQSVLVFSPDARQTVASIGWQIDSKRSLTGRFVDTNGFQNFFLSYQSAGSSGTDMYVILGDPNSVKFAKRISLKFVWAF